VAGKPALRSKLKISSSAAPSKTASDAHAVAIFLGEFENFRVFGAVNQLVGFSSIQVLFQPALHRVAVTCVRSKEFVDLMA
jgi:hypothetical protein